MCSVPRSSCPHKVQVRLWVDNTQSIIKCFTSRFLNTKFYFEHEKRLICSVLSNLLISWGHWVVVYLFKRVSVVSESHRLATRAVNLCYYNPVCYRVNFKEISSSLKQFLWQFRRIFPSSLHLCVAVSKQTMSCDYCYLTNTDVRTLWEILWLYPPVHLIMIVETFYGKWIFLCKSMSTLRWCGTLWCCTALFDFQTSIADIFGWIVLYWLQNLLIL